MLKSCTWIVEASLIASVTVGCGAKPPAPTQDHVLLAVENARAEDVSPLVAALSSTDPDLQMRAVALSRRGAPSMAQRCRRCGFSRRGVRRAAATARRHALAADLVRLGQSGNNVRGALRPPGVPPIDGVSEAVLAHDLADADLQARSARPTAWRRHSSQSKHARPTRRPSPRCARLRAISVAETASWPCCPRRSRRQGHETASSHSAIPSRRCGASGHRPLDVDRRSSPIVTTTRFVRRPASGGARALTRAAMSRCSQWISRHPPCAATAIVPLSRPTDRGACARTPSCRLHGCAGRRRHLGDRRILSGRQGRRHGACRRR
jgi:hypothetical protein